MSFLFNSVLYYFFLIIIIWSGKKKGNRYDLKKNSYNKANSNFYFSVSKVCASLICSGGICPTGYMS